MNIIFSTYETKEIGGSYLRSLSLAQELVKLGHTVTLWTSAKNISIKTKTSLEKNVRVIQSIGLLPYRFRRGGYDPFDVLLRTLIILLSPAKIIQSFNHRPAASIPGLVKSFFYPQTKWFIDWADLWGEGGIADRRHGPLKKITSWTDHRAEQFFIKSAPYLTCISDNLMKKAIKIRSSKKNIFYLPVGASINHIHPIPKLKARKKLGIFKKTPILVYLFIETYDEVFLAKSLLELYQLRKDINLLLIGPNSIPKFYSLIKSNPDLIKKIIHPGLISRELLPWYLAAGDIMLLPFTNKKINLGKSPNKLGDYLAAGRPIISNPTGEVKKILQKKQVGILAPENPKLFAQAIHELLKKPTQLKTLGENARKTAESLSWESVAKQLEKFYLK